MLKRVRHNIQDSQWWPLSDCLLTARGWLHSQNRTKCVKYVWLSYPTWPSRWLLCISMQWLRLKGCHVACDEWTSGEICSLQHMWVTSSVMWAAASDESLKFGSKVRARLTDFRKLTACKITGFDCTTNFSLENAVKNCCLQSCGHFVQASIC